MLELLGPWQDAEWAHRNAYFLAQQEVQSLTGIEQYFAAFNIGTCHVTLREYVDAAYAYDYAFQLYADLPKDDLRPFRTCGPRPVPTSHIITAVVIRT